MDLLIQLAKMAEEAVVSLKKAIHDYFAGASLEDHVNTTIEFERKADELKTLIKKTYPKYKFTYFDKGDFLYFVHKTDEILDIARDIVIMLDMNRVEGNIPEDVIRDIGELLENVMVTVRNTVRSAENLKLLAESSFSPCDKAKEEQEIRTVFYEEREVDTVSRRLGKKIYAMKHTLNPVDVIFLNKICRLLSKIADQAEDITKKIDTIL